MALLQRPPTRSGLLPEARHLVLPHGIKSSGFPAVRETCRRIGIEFDQWQQDLNKCLLAKDAHGLYASDTAVFSIPRQVGKTFDIGAVAFALCIGSPGLTVVWTAHRFKVSRESFNEMRGWARRSELVPHIDYDAITTAAGNECIPFRNGSRIVFAARERGAIRGFTKVGVLVLDEAQILTEMAMSDLVPTTNQSPNPLIVLMGTPPKPTDPGEVFTRLRQEALSGESQDILYVELSAEQDADPGDRKQWGIANLSYPKRTPARAILRMRKLLSEEDFVREGLGVWDAHVGRALFDLHLWNGELLDATSQAQDPVAFAFDVTPDRGMGAVGMAGRREDANIHVEIVDSCEGTSWLVPRLLELNAKWKPCVIVVDARSPAASLLPELAERGLRVTTEPKRGTGDIIVTTNAGEMAQACGAIFDGVHDTKSVRHLGQPELTSAMEGAAQRPLGDAWALSRGKSSANIAPLVAVTLAAYGLSVHGPEEESVAPWIALV